MPWRDKYPREVLDAWDAVTEKYASSPHCADCPDCGEKVDGNHHCRRYGTWTNVEICLGAANDRMHEHNAVLDAWIKRGKLPVMPVQMQLEI